MQIYKEFIKLHKKGFSLNQISKITKRTKNQIGNILRKKGIKPIRYDKLTKIDNLEQILIGSILGDGYLSKKPINSHCQLYISHCPKQLPYLEFKKGFFDELNLSANRGIKLYRDYSNRYKKGFTDTYSYYTKVHPLLSDYREKFYPSGDKIITEENISKLSKLGLAIWYMDDGQVCTSSYQINSTGFNKEGCMILINYLKKKFDLDFTLQKDNIMYLRTKSIKKFEKIIIPFVPNCMKYKIRNGSI